MSDISKIKLPNDFEYDIKDAKAVQTIKVGGITQPKTDGTVDLPATVSTYSATGTAPVNGTAVKASMTGTLDSTDSNHSATSKAVADSQAEQDAEIAVIANAGAKSLLPIGVSSITYANAVTFSVAYDGTITVNGTNPNGYAEIPYADLVTAKSSQLETRYTLPAGKYKITSTGDGLKFQVHCHDGTNSYPLYSNKSGGKFEYTSVLKALYPYICWRLTIDANASFSNQIVKPMIWNAEIKDSTFVPYAKTNRELTIAEVEQDEEIAWNANNGVKNLLKFDLDSVKELNTNGTWDGNVNTVEGVTITVNADKTISFVRTGSGADVYFLLTSSLPRLLSSGSTYILSGVTGGSSSTFYLGNLNNWENMDGDTEKTYNCGFNSIYAVITSTMPLNTPITIKPMIRPVCIKDSTFQPFAHSNTALTEISKATDTEIAVIANAGAKSLLPIGVSSITYANAVTFTVAHDGTITVNGTNPNSYAGIPYADLVEAKGSQLETRYTLPAGKYKITSTGDGLKFQVHCHDGTNAYALFSGKSGGEFEYTSALKTQYPYICWRLAIDANASFSNQIVKPMIWNAEIKDSTFQPYAPTNRELYEMTLAASAKFITKILAVDASQLNWAAENKFGNVWCSNFNTLYGSTISGWFSQVLSVHLGNYTSSLTPNGDFIIPVARIKNTGVYDQSNMIALWRMGTSTTKYTAGTIYLYIFGIANGYDSILN